MAELVNAVGCNVAKLHAKWHLVNLKQERHRLWTQFYGWLPAARRQQLQVTQFCADGGAPAVAPSREGEEDPSQCSSPLLRGVVALDVGPVRAASSPVVGGGVDAASASPSGPLGSGALLVWCSPPPPPSVSAVGVGPVLSPPP